MTSNCRLSSWNVNGIRSVSEKGFLEWVRRCDFDVICLQEVRSPEEKIPAEVRDYPGYQKAWFAADKSGYSGVAIWSRRKPLQIIKGMGAAQFDSEGRVIAAEFEHTWVVSAYFPNSQDEGKRLDFKVEFCHTLGEFLARLRKSGKTVVLGGDYNIAHREIDLARPKENEQSPGYFPEERAWMDRFLDAGWLDCFRHLHPRTLEAYTWWSFRTRARERNVGWRIDYFCMDETHGSRLKQAKIQSEVLGSDHCPVVLSLSGPI